MDFIVDLSKTLDRTTILVVVDRFYKMAYFVPLKKLPSAARIAQIFIKEIFHLHGVPQSIVSDHGVQFIYRFWGSFSRHLGIKFNFSVAYHP